jgi:hypothetical protein
MWAAMRFPTIHPAQSVGPKLKTQDRSNRPQKHAPQSEAQPLYTQPLVNPFVVESVQDRSYRNRFALHQGQEMIDRLELLLEKVLRQELTPDIMTHCTDILAHIAVPDDPDLCELIRDIELRLRVELAKLQKASELHP